ncbi:MAG: hypothetical protein M5F18_13030 [Asgard group archaeon]|nr:hypothetical protein [Asgard group archaeon]
MVDASLRYTNEIEKDDVKLDKTNWYVYKFLVSNVDAPPSDGYETRSIFTQLIP